MTAEISELLDDALDAPMRERVLDSLERQDGARRTWGCYCLVGDVIRGLPCLSPDFTARTMARLVDEPTVLAPVAAPRRRGLAARIALPLAASVMGVAVVVWVARDSLSPAPREIARSEVAPSPAAVAPAEVALSAAAAPERGEVTSYLFAHSAYVPSRTMQGVAPYVRVVTESASGVGR